MENIKPATTPKHSQPLTGTKGKNLSIPGHRRAPKADTIGLILVAAAVCLSPVLDSLPGIGRFSFAWMLYALLSVRVLTSNPQSLVKAVQQPLFLAAALFVLVSLAVEAGHSNPDFSSLVRFIQTLAGALLIACLCRTRETLSFALRSLAWFACSVSLVLIVTSYGKLSGVDVDEFAEASRLRGKVFGEADFFRDLNRWSFVCGLGAPVALALFSRSTAKRQRLRWAAVTIICLLGAAMPLSRSGIMVMLGACGVVLLWSGGNRLRLIPAAAVMVICVYALAPSAVFQRFKGSGGLNVESQDPRQRILISSLKSIPEYWLSGVGCGNYWHGWAVKIGISNKIGTPRGAHNSFFQVWMYWGTPGLLCFLGLLFFAFSCLPKNVGRDPLALCLLALAFAMVFRLLFTHVFYEKDFSAVLGLLAASRLWIWPAGKITPSRGLPSRASPTRHAAGHRFWTRPRPMAFPSRPVKAPAPNLMASL